jgi:argininosuccinate lyase
MAGDPSTHEGSLWGGRFSDGPSPEMAALSKSTHFDWRLVPYDLEATRAHAVELASAGYMTKQQLADLTSALESLGEDFVDGRLVPNEDDEDVHGALERELIERVGPETGGAVRAGRSRNDQIATFVRMFLRDQTASIRSLLIELARVLVLRSEEAGHNVMPGRTHFQHAQPVLVAHHLLAHAWPVVRDIQRLDDWSVRNNVSPYGSGALAGGGLGLDAAAIAKHLGFDAIADNSLDATSARDVVAEWAYIAAQIGVDISRIAEELIVFATKEFGYVSLDDGFSTGSSMMPQKKNPDIAELARGKAGRLVGNLTGLLTTLKALPLAYNRDLQEDKEPIFDSVDTLTVVLPALTGMLATVTFHYERMASLATEGFSLATDVADWLVVRGVPFREAHEVAGRLVAACEAKGVDLDGLTDAEYAEVSHHLDASVKDILTAEESIAKKNGPAGTAVSSVEAQRARLVAILGDLDR